MSNKQTVSVQQPSRGINPCQLRRGRLREMDWEGCLNKRLV